MSDSETTLLEETDESSKTKRITRRVEEPEPSPEELEARRVEWERLEAVTRHIRLVQDNCFKLAKGLHAAGESDFARKLIARSMVHDHTKFFGIEWLHLHRDTTDEDARKLAHLQHVSTNDHHPEFYEDGDHGQMSRLAVAEMLADWKSRSDEMGDSIIDWIENKGFPRYDIPKSGKIAKWIKYFLTILLDKPFTQLNRDS